MSKALIVFGFLRLEASLDPGNVQAHYNLAVVFEEAGQYDKAEPEYQSAMALDGKFYPASSSACTCCRG